MLVTPTSFVLCISRRFEALLARLFRMHVCFMQSTATATSCRVESWYFIFRSVSRGGIFCQVEDSEWSKAFSMDTVGVNQVTALTLGVR